jgi:hypothetical protein
MKIPTKAIAIYLFLLLFISCKTSKITHSWYPENVEIKKFKKVLVLSLIREADRNIQEQMENHFVGDLNNLGYNAISSLKEYGPKAFENSDEQTAINKLNNAGVDAIITIVLLDKQKERYYEPRTLTNSPYGYYFNNFWGYRNSLYRRIYEPDYYVIDTRYFWESNVYDMSNQKLVYSVQTQTFDPINAEKMGHEYGKMIVDKMVKDNILKQPKQ